MDALELAAINRARAALRMIAVGAADGCQEKAAAFTEYAWTTLLHAGPGEARNALLASRNELVAKAAAHSFADAVWDVDGPAALAAAYVATIAELSILDQIAKYATVLPIQSRRVMIASDSVGDVVAEGDPKPVRRIALSLGDVEPTKAVGILVLTQELVETTGNAGRRMFESELAKTVSRATNQSILAALDGSNTIPLSSTGDPLADLRAGLRAAGPSNGYVVAAPAGDVADLATRVEAIGAMGVRGGTFRPGIEVIAVEDQSGMVIIPASRLAIWDGGLQVRSAEHASLDMRDTPESPAQMVSLWQTNSLGLLVERNWHLAQAAEIVVVGGES